MVSKWPYVFSGASDHSIKVWDIKDKDMKNSRGCIATLVGHSGDVCFIDFVFFRISIPIECNYVLIPSSLFQLGYKNDFDIFIRFMHCVSPMGTYSVREQTNH